MTLPNGFQTAYDYFKQTIEFLRQNSWIYQEANTCFLKSNILQKMTKDYREYFRNIDNEELNQFPYVHQPLEKLQNPRLINFRQKLATLISEEAFKEPKEFKNPKKFENLRKINVKKQHEIQRLAAAVNEILQQTPKNKEAAAEKCVLQTQRNKEAAAEKYVLIDFGSGLGYLSEMLYELLNENLLILGLESDSYRVAAAQERVKTYMPPNATNTIQYRQQFITEHSKEFIETSVEELLQSNYQQIPTKMAIIGLHACADLTITSMKLFFQLPHVQHLIIMPCCYHKLQMCEANLKFANFPLSESLKQVLLEDVEVNYASATATAFLNRPFLRLACQQTLKRWQKCSGAQHLQHGREMFYRAVAEAIKHRPEIDSAGEEEAELVVVKRKEEGKIDLGMMAAQEVESFETFSRVYALKNKTTNEFVAWSENQRRKFAEIIEQYPEGWWLAEGLTCLQTSMQKLCENLVLYDRLCFMQETALKLNLNIKVRYEKLMDEELSPRCYALIAEKL